MKFPFQLGRREYVMEPVGEEHAADLAGLHQEAFSRSWSEPEFEALIAQQAVIGYLAREIGKGSAPPAGFVLARIAADEAEVLSIAVAKNQRGRGVGWALMDAVLRHMHAERVAEIFLEVEEANASAIALYRRLGFSEVGRRPAYYRQEGTGSGDALILRRVLRPPATADRECGDAS